MPHMHKLSNYRTTWVDQGNKGSVVYAHTEIVNWEDEKITLNSDGWESVTTKRKMNQAAQQFALGYSVYQKDHKWYVVTPTGQTLPYCDNMTFDRY